MFDTLCLTTYGCDFKSVAPAQVRLLSACTVHAYESMSLDYSFISAGHCWSVSLLGDLLALLIVGRLVAGGWAVHM